MPTAPTLWALHVQGPDDIVAEPDRGSAERNAAQLNDWYESVTKRDDYDPEMFPRVHAEVIEWPFSPQAHVDALAEQAEPEIVDVAIAPDGEVAR
jgi:hypothetical protein